MPSTPKVYLYKRNNGIYYVGYSDQGRVRWKSTSTSVKSDALKALANLQTLLSPKQITTPLSQFVKDFLQYAEITYAKRTFIIYRQALRLFEDIVGDITLNSLTLRHFDTYKVRRLERVRPVSTNIELRALKAAVNVAVSWKLLQVNPFARGKMARVEEKSPVFFSHADLDALLHTVKASWLREMIIFAVATGMRQGEIVNLRWDDIDLERRLIHIEGHPNFHTKQGRRRTIPISTTICEMLDAKSNRTTTEFVFTKKRSQIAPSYLTHQFKKHLRHAGLSEDLHWHSLRHTHASWLVQAGATLYEVQKLLGHSSSRVTEKYSHLQTGNLQKTVDRIRF